MTFKQQRFCELVAQGTDQSAAYREAYGASPRVANVNSVRVSNKPEVIAEIARLRKIARDRADDECVLSIIEKRKWLALGVRTAVTELDPKNQLTKTLIKKVSRKMIGSGENAIEIEEIEGYDKRALIALDNELAGDAPNKDAEILAALFSATSPSPEQDKM